MIVFYLCILSLCLWCLLLLHPDSPYLFNEVLPIGAEQGETVSIVIPCRNEEQVLEKTLSAIISMDYSEYEVILVDDCSSDSSKQIAKKYLQGTKHKLIEGKQVPEGWAGKMWALHQGIQHAKGEWILLSDADITYPKSSLSTLIYVAKTYNYDLVSVMVSLSTKSFWEKLLVPAFVYFFKILYPFKAIRKKRRKVAAAAGGCVLLKKDALEKIGGIHAIKGALIDDVALAKKIKSSGFNISLWLSKNIRSVREYVGISDLWAMVSRSAFTELKYSYFRLLMCIFGMTLLFILPVYFITSAIISNHFPSLFYVAISTYMVMTLSYVSAIRFYKISPFFSLLLPLIGVLYMLMTLDSALKYTLGTKANWKGRTY